MYVVLLVVRMKSSFSLMDLKRLTEKFTGMNQIGYLLKVVCVVAKMSAFRWTLAEEPPFVDWSDVNILFMCRNLFVLTYSANASGCTIFGCSFLLFSVYSLFRDFTCEK